MTKQEFESRMGYSIPECQWEMVNEMYMEAGDNINKDVFCTDYAKHRNSILLHTYYDKMVALQKELQDMQYKLDLAARELRSAADKLSDKGLRDRAAKLIGDRAAVLCAVRRNFILFDEDIRYIESNLK